MIPWRRLPHRAGKRLYEVDAVASGVVVELQAGGDEGGGGVVGEEDGEGGCVFDGLGAALGGVGLEGVGGVAEEFCFGL